MVEIRFSTLFRGFEIGFRAIEKRFLPGSIPVSRESRSSPSGVVRPLSASGPGLSDPGRRPLGGHRSYELRSRTRAGALDAAAALPEVVEAATLPLGQ